MSEEKLQTKILEMGITLVTLQQYIRVAFVGKKYSKLDYNTQQLVSFISHNMKCIGFDGKGKIIEVPTKDEKKIQELLEKHKE